MIKLTLRDGKPLYVNPAHVVCVMEHRVSCDDWEHELLCPHSDVRLRDDETAWLVRGTPEQIATTLNVGIAL